MSGARATGLALAPKARSEKRAALAELARDLASGTTTLRAQFDNPRPHARTLKTFELLDLLPGYGPTHRRQMSDAALNAAIVAAVHKKRVFKVDLLKEVRELMDDETKWLVTRVNKLKASG